MPIVLQEIVSIERGGKEAYLEGLRTRWIPHAEASRGMRVLWLGSTIGATAAWPETMAFWELRDWRHYAEVCRRMYTESSDDPELAAWWREAAPLRRSARSRTLVTAPFSPTLDDCLARGVAGTAFAFTTFRIRPGKVAALFAALERRLPVEEKQGRRLVGAYEVAFTNDLGYAIWAHPTIADLADYERSNAHRGWSDRACESWSEHWGYAAAPTPLWPRDVPASAKVW
jgi:hypothetical protein